MRRIQLIIMIECGWPNGGIRVEGGMKLLIPGNRKHMLVHAQSPKVIGYGGLVNEDE